MNSVPVVSMLLMVIAVLIAGMTGFAAGLLHRKDGATVPAAVSRGTATFAAATTLFLYLLDGFGVIRL